MPPKLQVDESFAFLFTCIEASGCKVDFKLVGDATDLQPAAARMRYTRLRKAVEAGHFKGATLVQPNLITASLSKLANPHSRRIGNDVQEQEQHDPNAREESFKSTARARPARLVNRDEEEEEEDEQEADAEEVIVGLEHLGRKKRRGAATERTPPVDDGLFFPDTSRSSRAAKRVELSDSVLGEDDIQEYAMPRSYRDATHPQIPVYNTREGQEQTTIASNSPIATHEVQQDHHTYRKSTPASRKKQSAVAAAAAAYNVGIRNGKWAPHPDDENVQDQDATYIPSPNYAQHLAYSGQGSLSESINPIWYNTHASGSPAEFNQSNPQSRGTTYSHLTHGQNSYLHGQSTVFKTSHHYNHTETDRFHPASVFEGFNAPTVLSYSPSARTGTGIQQNGEVSLLHKIRSAGKRADAGPGADVDAEAARGIRRRRAQSSTQHHATGTGAVTADSADAVERK